MNAAGTRLAALTKELWVQWQQTKECWRDVKGQEFEQKYMLDLFSTVDRSVATIEQLDKLITQIRKDCE